MGDTQQKSRQGRNPDGSETSWARSNNADAVRRSQATYVERALEGARRAITDGGGGRNVALNRESFGIGQLIGAGLLDRETAEALLLDAALAAGLPLDETRATVRSGLTRGIQNPRQIDQASPWQAPRLPPVTTDPKALDRMRAIWFATLPLDHPAADPARKYLVNRGLVGVLRDLPDPGVVRFHPELPYWADRRIVGRFPALVCRIQGPGDETVSLHRTYLTDDGKKAPVQFPKMVMTPVRPGALKGGAIRLYPLAGDRLGTAEGIETALACHLAIGLPVWSTLSASGLESFEPPKSVHFLDSWADLDASGAGQQAAIKLAERLTRQGIIVRVLLPPGPIPDGAKGLDWLDIWNRQQTQGEAA